MGIGHFLGLMPEAMHARSLITGIEIDPLTARLAKALYPDADIRAQPFEESKLADGFYDVAISNVPFGVSPVHDPRLNAYRFPIHDYFFATALDKVRPGGLVMFITSRGTMDKQMCTTPVLWPPRRIRRRHPPAQQRFQTERRHRGDDRHRHAPQAASPAKRPQARPGGKCRRSRTPSARASPSTSTSPPPE